MRPNLLGSTKQDDVPDVIRQRDIDEDLQYQPLAPFSSQHPVQKEPIHPIEEPNDLNEALIRWIIKGDLGAVQALLDAKADLTYKSRLADEEQYGKSAIEITQQFQSVCELVMKQHQKRHDELNNALIHAVVNSDVKEVLFLIRKGADSLIARSSRDLRVREAYRTIVQELDVSVLSSFPDRNDNPNDDNPIDF